MIRAAIAFFFALCGVANAQLSGGLQFPGPGTAHSAGVATTTWDPATVGPGITLSGGNLTASSVAGGNANARSVASHTTSKYYFEGTWTVQSNGIVGFMDSTFVNNTYMGNGAAIGAFSGGWLTNGGGTTTAPSIVVGHRYGFAVDIPNKTAWVIDWDAGTPQWNADATANPATNVNGVNFSLGMNSGTYLAGVTPGGALDSFTANFSGPYFGTVPSGFGNW